MLVPAAQVVTSAACLKTVQQRSETLSAVRKIASGEDSNAQLGIEIQALTKPQKENLLKYP